MDGQEISRAEGIALLLDSARKVAFNKTNGHHISTVLLVINHNFGDGQPLIFETMIFCVHDGECGFSGYQERYATKQEAIDGHARAVRKVINGNYN
jgi:hypothetical protein